MKNNIAIALNAGTPAQRNAITSYFADVHCEFWHWIDDFWIVRIDSTVTAKAVYDALKSLPVIGTTTLLVFQFDAPVKYYGRADQAAWDWLSMIGQVSQ